MTLGTTLSPASGLIGRAVNWWLGELSDLVPGRVRGAHNRLLITWSDDELLFERVRGSEHKVLGRHSLAQDDVSRAALRRGLERSKGRYATLQLSTSRILKRHLALPLAAEENLREVLAFEMDRHTPFAAKAVYYDYRVRDRDLDLGLVHLDLFLIPKETLDPILRELSSLGLNTTRCTAQDEPGINLLADPPRNGTGTTARRFGWPAALVVAAILAAAVLLPLHERQKSLADLEQQLDAARRAAFDADKLREQVALRLTESRYLVEEKQANLPIIALLDEVTRSLPDDAWLIQFSLRQDRLTLAGYADKPTELIGLLESSDRIAEVAFTSPVVMDPRVGRERFNLQAQVSTAVAP